MAHNFQVSRLFLLPRDRPSGALSMSLRLQTTMGRKRLTTAGGVSIGLTIFGLVVSIVSEDMQQRQASNIQSEQITTETQRTNENHHRGPTADKSFASVAVSQAIILYFLMQSRRVRAKSKRIRMMSRGGVPPVPYDEIEYDAEVLPLISYIARCCDKSNKSKSNEAPEISRTREGTAAGSMIVLMPLDEFPKRCALVW